MNKPPITLIAAACAALLTLSLILPACKGVRTALDVADVVLSAKDIACLEDGEGSRFTDAKEAATACKIANATAPLLDLIRNLIGQREAAKRAGFVWGGGAKPADAGADGS